MDDGTVVRIEDRPLPHPGRHRITVSTALPGFATRTATVEITVPADPADAEKLRWYLEDYAGFPTEPGPAMAAEAEQLLDTLGRELFTAVFGDGDPRDLWNEASSGGLDRLRIEVDADPADVPGLPWELLRDRRGSKLAVEAGQFVRTHTQAGRTRLPHAGHQRLRVLLVICRPSGRDDVPFRSVAARLVRGGVDRLDGLDLDVLRPATFAQLSTVLRAAARADHPYQVVHFDGHGTYRDVLTDGEGRIEVSATRYGPSLAAPARAGQHGYLLFERPGSEGNQELVDGPTLADLLVETAVPVLVLNACRSAYAEAPSTPDPTLREVNERVRAYGSLAAEVADRGVAGVVAMRYNVYVVTAAQFVADLYTSLLAGLPLGEAAAAGRRALAADPARALGASPVALQDWMVPTVYDAAPRTLINRPAADQTRITLHCGDTRSRYATDLPAAPDIGFYGRDEALLALDRAFDTDRIVLLHAYAGAGKTTTVAEFARWYLATGGLRHTTDNSGPDDHTSVDDDRPGHGVVLWTSFEHHTPLERVLDTAGARFAALLEANDVHWAAVTDPAERRELILRVLAAVPVLWVWDNVEPVTGFPPGTPSAWTEPEQTELRGFLRELRDRTQTRVLLTSRRDEHGWLADLPHRLQLTPMPMWERLLLIRALLGHLGAAEGTLDWRPLARFCGGNPLAITVAVRQAVRVEHVTNTAQLEGFVARVEAGTTGLEPAQNAELGRSDSLAASLAYGFDRAFTDVEHTQLALLHLFRDTVDIDVLRAMGDPGVAGADAVAALAGADREQLTALLDRAAEIGLLTSYGGGYYGIHPALPWFFTDLFTRHTPDPDTAARAYTHAHGALGDYYFEQVESGHAAAVLSALRVEEANLRHALHLARTHQLLGVALGCVQGLRQLYELTGRDTEWARLVADIQFDYIDPTTDQPRPGREDDYSIVTGYRVDIARARRDWPTATRLQIGAVARDLERAAPFLELSLEKLDPAGRHFLRTYSISENVLGKLLRDQNDPACRQHFQIDYNLSERLGYSHGQAVTASNLGNAYLFVTGLRDLDQAQHWHQRSLDLMPEHDLIARAAANGSLATVAYHRLLEARDAGSSSDEIAAHLEQARAGHQRALDLLPDDHHEFRATAHNQLGNLYREIGDVSKAMSSYQQCLRHEEARGNTWGAGTSRYNIAVLLAEHDRRSDARHYAHAALENFQQVGLGGQARAALANELIHKLG